MTDTVLQTERLTLRRFTLDDASFVYELVNQRSFREFIGDKGVNSLDDARDYIEDGPLATFEKYGYCVYVVGRSANAVPIGMCGLFKRDNLDRPDIGFAFLERYFKHGFATESSLGVMRYAQDVLSLPALTAIVDPENARSIALVEKLGFSYERAYRMPDEDKDLCCYAYYFERDS